MLKRNSFQSRMVAKQLTRIAMMACILSVAFTCCSQILYLEIITLTLALFAFVFTKKEVVLAALVFAIVNMLIQGISIWTMMYAIIYPIYALILASSKKFLLKHRMVLVFVVSFFSFLTGQLLDLPFILFSSKVTIFYILLGLKTSLIQGALTAIEGLFLFDPLYNSLILIERKIK